MLTAQSRLPVAQNAILTVWITYLNTRFQLYRDMELMPLDFRGVWQDDTVDCECPGKLTPAANPANPPNRRRAGPRTPPRTPGGPACPSHKRWSRKAQLLLGAGVVLALAAGTVTFLLARNPFQQSRNDLVLHHVKYDRLELTVVERGTLESAKNADIFCTVKAGQGGRARPTSSGSSTTAPK